MSHILRLALPGTGKLGTAEIWNGKIWHNDNMPNYVMVFEGPNPFF